MLTRVLVAKNCTQHEKKQKTQKKCDSCLDFNKNFYKEIPILFLGDYYLFGSDLMLNSTEILLAHHFIILILARAYKLKAQPLFLKKGLHFELLIERKNDCSLLDIYSIVAFP